MLKKTEKKNTLPLRLQLQETTTWLLTSRGSGKRGERTHKKQRTGDSVARSSPWWRTCMQRVRLRFFFVVVALAERFQQPHTKILNCRGVALHALTLFQSMAPIRALASTRSLEQEEGEG